MRLIALAAVAFLLVPVSAAAQDFAGKWSGSFAVNRPDGTVGNDSIHLDLTVKGAEVTGTAGPALDRQWPLKGKIVKGQLICEVQSNGPLIKFTLAIVEGRLKGDAMAEDGGQKFSAKVDAGRVKAGS